VKRTATGIRAGPRMSELFDQDRTEGGSKGVRAVRSRSDGGN
jgi:hypothetical protein